MELQSAPGRCREGIPKKDPEETELEEEGECEPVNSSTGLAAERLVDSLCDLRNVYTVVSIGP
jgi:hypothetical protein